MTRKPGAATHANIAAPIRVVTSMPASGGHGRLIPNPNAPHPYVQPREPERVAFGAKADVRFIAASNEGAFGGCEIIPSYASDGRMEGRKADVTRMMGVGIRDEMSKRTQSAWAHEQIMRTMRDVLGARR